MKEDFGKNIEIKTFYNDPADESIICINTVISQ
jgi:hypothetical protein